MQHPLSRLFLPLRRVALVTAALCASWLTGCSAIDDQGPLRWLAPYRMEIVQGNVVTSDMVQSLREGQTRDQVRMLLGSPLLTDLFHADRWDYIFTIRRQGAAPQQRGLTVFFNGDRVQRFQAGPLPDERTFVASIEVDKPEPRRTPLALDDDGLRALPLPKPTAAAPASSAPAGALPQRNYPPLEPGSSQP